MLDAEKRFLRLSVTVGLLVIAIGTNFVSGCQFHPVGEYLKFVRVPENLLVGSEVLRIEVHPRSHLQIMPVDKEEDSRYFTFNDVNSTHISVILAQSLEDLVDADVPRNLLKFRLACDYSDNTETLVSSHLSVTVYVEDVNDHAPQFAEAPYHVTVDELTPTGLTIFRGIHAVDRDKPNTPNSDVHYAIVRGNEEGKFSLESGHRTALILRKSLDYDAGDREYLLVINAADRGTPQKSSNTTISIMVVDNDDLDPKFTQDVYRTEIFEFYPFPTHPIHREIDFTTPIRAFDQDRDIDIPVRYDIVSGNERGIFYVDPRNGSLYLERPIDLDAERNLPGNTFVLQIHATQVDNPLKVAVARIEIEILDLNDNLPEFEVDFYNISIVENLPNGFSVLQVVAVDRDQGANGEFTYELDDPSGAFSVEPQSGWLTVQDQTVLDREKKSFLKMKVLAAEKRPSVVKPFNGTSSVDVEVTLLDANDNNPVFVPGNLLELVARTDFKVGTVLGQVHAVDNDLGSNGLVRYRLQRPGNSSADMPFDVHPETGVIVVSQSPIVEGRHAIFVEASDQPINPSERRVSLAVVTIDVFRPDGQGSREPDFIGAPYEFWVGANVPIGTSVGQIRMNDAVKSNEMIYDLLHSYHSGVPFAVEERSGTITVVDHIENYEKSLYDFEAVVTDEKDLMLVTNVTVHVVDPNDESGLFTKGSTKAPLVFRVKENAVNAFIGKVLPQNGSGAMRSVRFLIANQQDVPDIRITEDGTLFTPNGLDREARQNYSLTVIAESPRGVSIIQVTVIVEDEDDNAPIFTASSYEGHLLENSASGTEVIMSNHVSARDPDEDANLVFVLRGDGSGLFRIDRAGQIFFIGSGGDSLDREVKPLYNLKIVAGDEGKKTSEVPLTIHVDDENDNAPGFVQMIIIPDHGIKVSKNSPYSANSVIEDSSRESLDSMSNDQRSPLLYIPENVTIGAPIIRCVARDRDEGPNAEITYSILSENILDVKSKFNIKRFFVMDSRSGEISVAGALPPESNIRLQLVAKDTGGLEDSVAIRIHVVDVNDHAPVFKQSSYSFDIPEGFYQHYKIGKINAVDVDFGQNANVTYRLLKTSTDNDVRFDISPYQGDLMVTGTLDRETRDVYNFKVVASDNGPVSMNSNIEVELNVLDVNDNPPTFYGYQEVGKLTTNLVDIYRHEMQALVPIYYATVPENSPIGTVVTKIYANDTDFAGNGNGLILFDVPQVPNEAQLFTIDSKEGLISTIGNLDYEKQSLHNLTIIASDLGSPSLTSTAMLHIRVLDVDEGPEDSRRPIFQHRYYEVEIEENSEVPVKLLDLAVSDIYKNEMIRYSIVIDDSDAREHFSVDSKNGSVYMLTSPDRETKDRYEIKVRVDKVKTARGMPVMIYPVVGERLNGLAPNEARIIVKIKDVNDNAPQFKTHGRPILAAVSTSAHYGADIIKVETDDPDEGINGEVRYQILGREDSPKFAIDPVSGQVQSAGSFARDAGRVFGFDVKATDRRGADDGRSSIANVFVYVLDDNKQLVMIMGKKPTEIETEINEIAVTLQNVTGLDVRVRKVEPHIEKNLIDVTSSDMYLYAVDPNLNVMIDTDTLQNVFRTKKSEIKRELEKYRVLDIAGNKQRRSNQRYLLSTLEVGVVVLGCVVFVGALVTALCVTCVRRKKRRHRQQSHMFPGGTPIGFALADPSGTLQKSSLFPSYVEGLHYDPAASYSGEMRQQSMCEHEPNCVRFHSCSRTTSTTGKRAIRRGAVTGLETSATSLHSSGQDSGIVAGGLRACHCSNSSSPSSGESSNGYEDSLKSLQRRARSNEGPRQDVASTRRGNAALSRKRHRFHSFSNLESIYQQESNLHRDKRFQTMMDQKRHNSHNAHLVREHRRALSEAENNITETVIQEHPGVEMSMGTLTNASSIHGKGKVHGPTPSTTTTLLRPDNGVLYSRPRRAFP